MWWKNGHHSFRISSSAVQYFQWHAALVSYKDVCLPLFSQIVYTKWMIKKSDRWISDENSYLLKLKSGMYILHFCLELSSLGLMSYALHFKSALILLILNPAPLLTSLLYLFRTPFNLLQYILAILWDRLYQCSSVGLYSITNTIRAICSENLF